MANPGDTFIVYNKPKKNSAEVFRYVSEGMLSVLHTQKQKKALEVKILDEFRRSPLHYSCYLNLEPMSLYLLISGIDTNVLDKFNQSCYHALLGKGNYKALQVILNYEIHLLRKELSE